MIGVYSTLIGVIAGGDRSLRVSSEAREDDPDGAHESLEEHGVHEGDTVLGTTRASQGGDDLTQVHLDDIGVGRVDRVLGPEHPLLPAVGLHEGDLLFAPPGQAQVLEGDVVRVEGVRVDRHGIRQAGFWTTEIGPENHALYYLLEWESLAEREEKWNAFQADPEWIEKRAQSEKDGPIVATIENMILKPTAFSSVK